MCNVYLGKSMLKESMTVGQMVVQDAPWGQFGLNVPQCKGISTSECNGNDSTSLDGTSPGMKASQGTISTQKSCCSCQNGTDGANFNVQLNISIAPSSQNRNEHEDASKTIQCNVTVSPSDLICDNKRSRKNIKTNPWCPSPKVLSPCGVPESPERMLDVHSYMVTPPTSPRTTSGLGPEEAMGFKLRNYNIGKEKNTTDFVPKKSPKRSCLEEVPKKTKCPRPQTLDIFKPTRPQPSEGLGYGEEPAWMDKPWLKESPARKYSGHCWWDDDDPTGLYNEILSYEDEMEKTLEDPCIPFETFCDVPEKTDEDNVMYNKMFYDDISSSGVNRSMSCKCESGSVVDLKEKRKLFQQNDPDHRPITPIQRAKEIIGANKENVKNLSQHQKTPGRTIFDIKMEVESKVRKFRKEAKIINGRKLAAVQEQNFYQQERKKMQESKTDNRKMLLLKTLADLKMQLENQSSRLQRAYSTVLDLKYSRCM